MSKWDNQILALKKEEHEEKTKEQQQEHSNTMEEKTENELVGQMQVALKKAKKVKDDRTWTAICEGLGLQDRDCSSSRIKCAHRLGKAAYFLLLVFSELDFVMFIVGFNTYWNYDDVGREVVKIILISFPFAFMISLVLNQMQVDHDDVTHADNDEAGNLDPLKRITRETNRMMALPAFRMKLYHFIPGLRGMLFLENPDGHYIEAMFRVNTLSSFCLGVAQLIGAVFYVGVGGGDMSLEIYMNLTTLSINWLITILYYLTPIARYMSDAVSAENFSVSIQNFMEEDKNRWLASIGVASELIASQNAEKVGAASDGSCSMDSRSDLDADDADLDFDDLDLLSDVGPPTKSKLTAAHLSMLSNPEEQAVAKFRKKVQAEINLLCNVLVDLDNIPLTQLVELRMRIFKKHIHLFSDL